MRISPVDSLGFTNLDGAQHGKRTLVGFAFAVIAVHQEGFLDLFTNGHHRIHRIFRILHDHRDTATTNPAHGAPVCIQQIGAFKF